MTVQVNQKLKKFIKRNNLVFKQGYYEDIFYLFKAHFYNNRKIYNFKDNYKDALTYEYK